MAATDDGTELDFWLGDWDVAWEGGRGTNRLARILGGRVIHEQFRADDDADGSPGLRGESWSVFDAGRRLWRQTWVTQARSRCLQRNPTAGTATTMYAPR